jgi:ubiquinone/menaquinone biosynthesis C-methylase UbiE
MKQKNNHRVNPHLTFPKRLLYKILRTFYSLLYHQLAWTYDWIASIVSLGAWQSWVQSVLPYLNGRKILELGFGPGHLQVSLYQKEISVFGLDESSQMAKIAYHRINELGMYPFLVRGKAQTLPFSDECFQQVVMTFPSGFILNSQTIYEIHRVLVFGGEAVILPFVWMTGRKPLERAFAWLYRITGETPEWDEKSLDPLKKMGFDVSWKVNEYTSSKILLILLKKNSNH